MEWLIGIAALVGAGGVVSGLRRLAVRRHRARDEAVEMAGVREMADEDTTLLGEQLARLGAGHPGDAMEESTRTDYQAALDAYESAKRAVPRLTRPEEVSTVVDTLSTGRYALACVQARLEGRPIPELRVPCFFNRSTAPRSQTCSGRHPVAAPATYPPARRTRPASQTANDRRSARCGTGRNSSPTGTPGQPSCPTAGTTTAPRSCTSATSTLSTTSPAAAPAASDRVGRSSPPHRRWFPSRNTSTEQAAALEAGFSV